MKLSIPEIIWRLRDKQALRRIVELQYPGVKQLEAEVDAVVHQFERHIELHPLEWPTSASASSDHSWCGCRTLIRYRFIPSPRAVQVLSIETAAEVQKRKNA